jgi:hypothetical protein
MADLDRRSSYTPRAVREQRAYRLAMTGGGAGVAAVVTGVLAVLGIVPFIVPVLAVVIAVICGLLFQRIVAKR